MRTPKDADLSQQLGTVVQQLQALLDAARRGEFNSGDARSRAFLRRVEGAVAALEAVREMINEH
jgi:hypothetical protein